MRESGRIVPIPSTVILLLALTAVFVAAIVPGGTVAGPLLAILTSAFVAPWRSFPYRLPVRIATVVAALVALGLAGLRIAA